MLKTLWKTVSQFLKNMELPIGPSNWILGHLWQRNEDLHSPKSCTKLFKVVLFIKAPKWKQPICPSMDELLNHATLSTTQQ